MIQCLSPFLLSSGENNGLESGPRKSKYKTVMHYSLIKRRARLGRHVREVQQELVTLRAKDKITGTPSVRNGKLCHAGYSQKLEIT